MSHIVAANEQVLPMVGDLKNLRLATEVHDFIQRLKIYSDVQKPILVTTVTLERLKKRGYEPMLEHYLKVSPQLNEPLYARPACTVV